MLRRLRPRLTYANVVSSICLFLLLGGGAAFAARQLAKSSVGTKQLKKSAVTGEKVKDGSLTGADLADGSVSGTDVADGSVAAVDLAPGTIPPPDAPGTPPGGTIPVGTTLRGIVSPIRDDAYVGADKIGQGVSFGGYQLPARPTVNVVLPGGPSPAACPGTAEAPDATSGNLCVYVRYTQPATGNVVVFDPTRESTDGVQVPVGGGSLSVFGDGKASRMGFTLRWDPATNSNVSQLQGSWAATG
jgi:hypothetical protein